MRLRNYIGPETTVLQQRAKNWEEAVAQAGALLEKTDVIEPAYTKAMVDMVKELGPYIVIMPGVALAHARPNGHVRQNGIAVVTYSEGIPFGNEANDPVYIVFAVAACTDEEHLELFQTLAEFIAQEENVERLKKAVTFNEIGF